MERLKLRPKVKSRKPALSLGISKIRRGELAKGLMVPYRNVGLTPLTITRFCFYVKKGLPFDGVCDYLGINHGQFWSWLSRGQRFLDCGNTPTEDQIYGVFVQRARKASAKYRFRLIRHLHEGSAETWRREMSILSRRDRKNFGKDVNDTQAEGFDPSEQFL